MTNNSILASKIVNKLVEGAEEELVEGAMEELIGELVNILNGSKWPVVKTGFHTHLSLEAQRCKENGIKFSVVNASKTWNSLSDEEKEAKNNQSRDEAISLIIEDFSRVFGEVPAYVHDIMVQDHTEFKENSAMSE